MIVQGRKSVVRGMIVRRKPERRMQMMGLTVNVMRKMRRMKKRPEGSRMMSRPYELGLGIPELLRVKSEAVWGFRLQETL